MNVLGKPFRKKIRPKRLKKQKHQSEIAACEQKTTSEKANFCSKTVFSLYFKIRATKLHAAKSLAFSLHFLFLLDQNHYSNLPSKIMKMCEQILKKQRPNTIQISNSLNCNNSPSYRGAVIKEKTKRRPIIDPAIAVGLLNRLTNDHYFSRLLNVRMIVSTHFISFAFRACR